MQPRHLLHVELEKSLHLLTSVSGLIDREDVSVKEYKEGINGGSMLALKLQKIIWHFGSDSICLLVEVS